MKLLLQQMYTALSRLAAPYPANPKVGLFRSALSSSRRPLMAATVSCPIAIQSVEDPFYFALFGAIVAEINRHRRALGELVVVRAMSGAIGVDWRARLRRSVPMTWILSTQWVRAFAGLADRVAYRSHSWSSPVHDLADWFRSVALWRRVRHQQGDLTLEIQGVAVGDLLSDTYLRFRPSPRFDATDPFVLQLIWQAHCAIRRARRYFRSRTPLLYLTSYSTYLEHGIPVRVALQEGIRVYSFGSLSHFDKELTLSDWHHTANGEHYRSIFASLEGQDRRLAEAEQQLRKRLSGGIDVATSYMKVSAYANSGEATPDDLAGAVVVFLHDFYDSPHIYPDIIFGDFWRWACFTIETLSEAGTNFYLKPHPNQVELSSNVLEELRAAYPSVRFLPHGITNAQLTSAGIACGVTVYGTVAHELAYLGVPTVASARHPHIAFNFCRTARSQAEYAAFLRSATEPHMGAPAMRREALAFYYMHNLHGDAGNLALRSRFVTLWKTCQDPEASSGALLSALSDLRQSPGFEERVLKMLETNSDVER